MPGFEHMVYWTGVLASIRNWRKCLHTQSSESTHRAERIVLNSQLEAGGGAGGRDGRKTDKEVQNWGTKMLHSST